MAGKNWLLHPVYAMGIAINAAMLGLAVARSGDTAALWTLLAEDRLVEWMQFLCFAVIAILLGFTAAKLTRSPYQRTGYLHVNYRKIAPIEKELQVDAGIDRIEGRKIFVVGKLCDGDDVLTEARGSWKTLLMVGGLSSFITGLLFKIATVFSK